jgi:transcriptional regulator with XRE-family HTH domain
MKKLFGTMLRQARRTRGLTLQEVASKTGSSKGYFSGVENGKINPPTYALVEKIARLLGIPESDLCLFAFAVKAPKQIQNAPEFIAFKDQVLVPFRKHGLLKDES